MTYTVSREYDGSFLVGEMMACCSQARAVVVAETSSYAAASTSTRWSAKKNAGNAQQRMVKGFHFRTRLVVVEKGLVASSKRRAPGLMVEAVKRISTGRSYALSSTLKIEEEAASIPCPKGEGGLDDATRQAGTKQQSMVINQGLGKSDERATFDLDFMSKKMSLKDKADNADQDEAEEGFSLKTLFGIKK